MVKVSPMNHFDIDIQFEFMAGAFADTVNVYDLHSFIRIREIKMKGINKLQH